MLIAFYCLASTFTNELSQRSKVSVFPAAKDEKEVLEQFLIDQHYLEKAYLFSLNTTDEYDNSLIEFVRSYINKPSQLPLNLNDKSRTDFSQIGQSKTMDTALKSMRNGFFIEAGGFDGESHSVSF